MEDIYCHWQKDGQHTVSAVTCMRVPSTQQVGVTCDRTWVCCSWLWYEATGKFLFLLFSVLSPHALLKDMGNFLCLHSTQKQFMISKQTTSLFQNLSTLLMWKGQFQIWAAAFSAYLQFSLTWINHFYAVLNMKEVGDIEFIQVRWILKKKDDKEKHQRAPQAPIPRTRSVRRADTPATN